MSETRAETIAAGLETFIRERFQVPPDDDFFTRSVDLWDEGYVDSAGVVETLAYLEETHGIQLPEEIVFDPDFTHIDGMARLVARLLEP